MMFRLKSALIIGLLSALSLTACSEAGDTVKDAADKAKDTAAETTEKVKDTATETAEKAKDTVAETVDKGAGLVALNDMKDSVTSTLDAAKTGDFDTAKTEFAKVQEAWPALKDNIKPDSAQSIQEGIETVKASLGEGEPNKDKIVGELTNLLKSVTGIQLG